MPINLLSRVMNTTGAWRKLIKPRDSTILGKAINKEKCPQCPSCYKMYILSVLQVYFLQTYLLKNSVKTFLSTLPSFCPFQPLFFLTLFLFHFFSSSSSGVRLLVNTHCRIRGTEEMRCGSTTLETICLLCFGAWMTSIILWRVSNMVWLDLRQVYVIDQRSAA